MVGSAEGRVCKIQDQIRIHCTVYYFTTFILCFTMFRAIGYMILKMKFGGPRFNIYLFRRAKMISLHVPFEGSRGSVTVWIWNVYQKLMYWKVGPQDSSVQKLGLWEVIRSWRLWHHQWLNPLMDSEFNGLLKSGGNFRRWNLVGGNRSLRACLLRV
jgi:hypothetical protein